MELPALLWAEFSSASACVFVCPADKASSGIEYGFPLRHVLPVRKAFSSLLLGSQNSTSRLRLALRSLKTSVRARSRGLPAMGRGTCRPMLQFAFSFVIFFPPFRYGHDFRALSPERKSPQRSIHYGARGQCREENQQNQEEAADA